MGTKAEIMTCVATMIESILTHNILSPDELLEAIKRPLDRLKEELNNKED